MRNLTTDTPDHDAKADQDLYDLLKTGEETGNDEDESTVGTNPDPEPDDVEEEGIDASWGDKPESNDARSFSDAVYAKFRQGREELLGKLFDSAKSSDPAEQAQVGQLLSHGASGSFETSSPQLSDKSKQSSVQDRLRQLLR